MYLLFKLEDGEKEIYILQSQVHSMQSELKDMGRLKSLETTLSSQKWDEFGRLADSMKSLSRSMVHSGSPSPTRSGSRLLDYS